MSNEKTTTNGKVSFWNKIAFGVGDIFGGGSFNVINFLYTSFLSLVVGIPMVWVSPILLFTKIWDGIIDPFIGKLTDGKQPGKFGKRRWFMLVFAPFVFVGLFLLFFPWNLITNSLALKIIFVIVCYMFYATAQSLVLIPYYSHASEMTDDYKERNSVNAVRLCFSLLSSIVCVALPGKIASPDKGSESYIIMSCLFGGIFLVSILVTALFSREQIVTPAIKRSLSFKEFIKPLKLKTYRQQLGMQMCNSMAMAIMSSFFFILINFYLKRETYSLVTLSGGTIANTGIGTVAAALMFAVQIVALPFYMRLMNKKSKRFAYMTAALLWVVFTVAMIFLPAETGAENINGVAQTVAGCGVPGWVMMMFGALLGFAIGGTNIVVQSSFGDVCDAGELYFGERTEGAFSGLTNFLNTTAQAIGLSIPPLVTGALGFVETQYLTEAEFNALTDADYIAKWGMAKESFAISQSSISGMYQLLPSEQPEGAQIAILLTFTIVPIIIMIVGFIIASRYKLDKNVQQKIAEVNAMDKSSKEYKQKRVEVLAMLDVKASENDLD